jgi:Protein kinase domain
VLSPSKELDLIETPFKKKDLDENDKNVPNLKINTNDSGFISKVENIKLFDNEKVALSQPTASHIEKNIPFRQVKIRTELFPTYESKPLANEKKHEAIVPSIFQTKELKKEEPAKIAFRNPLTQIVKQPENNLETPFKQNDKHLFITPSARPFSITNSMSSLTCDREQNKRPKVLFTTPVARPMLGPAFIETPREQIKNHAKLSPIKEPSSEKEKPKENVISINGNEYIIDKKIGSGGSSSVFLATCKKSKKECAIKLVNLDGDATIIEGYLDETKTLAKLQGNINVIALYEYSHLPEKKILYMVMEKGDSDLHKILQGYKSHIPLYTLMSYWYQMLQAVNYIHENGVIHSDLKPGIKI